MDKTTRPQQLSFSFEEPNLQSTVVNLPMAQVVATGEVAADDLNDVAVVYDFRAAVAKRKESVHASLYRQILDSVRHLG